MKSKKGAFQRISKRVSQATKDKVKKELDMIESAIPKKVYGIYCGCIYEGGGVGKQLYLDIAHARDAAIKEVEKENAWMNKSNEKEVAEGEEPTFKLYSEKETNI